MIQMLRKEAASGAMDDMSHIRTEVCLSDALTKFSAKPDTLLKAVDTGLLPEVDTHPPFRTLLKHRAYLTTWLVDNIPNVRECVFFFGDYVFDTIQSFFTERTRTYPLGFEDEDWTYQPSVFMVAHGESPDSLCMLD